ncbi:MAG: GNAT family N-acetyltransferase [Lachnospiraceae bacterium]|nr:GNAT family N-acetyltransferase [Lachnospiraceae bacterium]
MPLFSDLYTGDIMAFDRNDRVAAGVLTQENEPVALLLSSVQDDTMFLDWFYVREKFRHQGIGTEFLNKMLDMISMAYKVELASVASASEEASAYFRWQGFVPDEGRIMGIANLTLGDMISLPVRNLGNGRRLIELNDGELRRMNHYFVGNDNITVTVDLPVDPHKYLEESAVDMRNNEVYSLLLLEEDGDALFVSYAYSSNKNVLSLMALLSNAKKRLIERYGADKKIKIAAVNEKSMALVNKLFNTPKTKKMFMGTKVLVFDPYRDAG